ncbi:MAG: hypothetical protein Q7T01_01845 [bacterium]|nr:hypothetical protein [bacterium]
MAKTKKRNRRGTADVTAALKLFHTYCDGAEGRSIEEMLRDSGSTTLTPLEEDLRRRSEQRILDALLPRMPEAARQEARTEIADAATYIIVVQRAMMRAFREAPAKRRSKQVMSANDTNAP